MEHIDIIAHSSCFKNIDIKLIARAIEQTIYLSGGPSILIEAIPFYFFRVHVLRRSEKQFNVEQVKKCSVMQM